jgi:flagellar basal body rod protein FlgG
VTPDGARLLDAGGAPVFVPPGAGTIALSADGTLSADGQPLAQIGLFRPIDRHGLTRAEGTRFRRASVASNRLRRARSCRVSSRNRMSIRSPRSPG